MQNSSSKIASTRMLERILAGIGTVVCLTVSVLVWLLVGAQQPLWPFPALYLIEMAAVSILGMACIWSNESRLSALCGISTWTAAGIMFAFVIMGAFSIGYWFLPTAGLFAIAALLSTRRQGRNLVVPLCVGLPAALAQAALMLAVIRILYP
jgi:hypothetical protein